MDKDDNANLDVEYNRYLQILQPYIEQLLDLEDIELCNAWIRRLSDYKEDEKTLRNKYLFTLCCQLAKGILKHPFCSFPPPNELPVLDEASDDSLSEGGSNFTLGFHNSNGEILVGSTTLSKTILQPKDSELTAASHSIQKNIDNIDNKKEEDELKLLTDSLVGSSNSTVTNLCYPEILKDLSKFVNSEDNVYLRVNNLIDKLRQIKKQNTLLLKELQVLKEESISRQNILQIHCATNTSISIKANESTDVDSKGNLSTYDVECQNDLSKLCKQQSFDIEELKKQHEIELNSIKTAAQQEVQDVYEKNIQTIKQDYEMKIKEMKTKHENEINKLRASLIDVNFEKENIVALKNHELINLRAELDEAKANNSVLRSGFVKACNDFNSETVKEKALEFEKRLYKIEKSKNKHVKAYQMQLASLQRDKCLLDSSLHLQLLKQRTELLTEFTEENQKEILATVEKLEGKYKEMVANVQASAIQRRIQDQIALETVVHAVYGGGFKNGHATFRSANNNVLKSKLIRNRQDNEEDLLASLQLSGVGKNSKDKDVSKREDDLVTGFCLDEVKLEELYERVHIPQRDTCNN
ncbi:PREDICTED: nucleoporin nup211-like [Papilio polytes]|uniref:nucleoporin nup211-like n=1 Tax=Papilio polytes TaxID=76194 RepID=UPI00067600A9|nr:PREDICTED: nucleoporin nup211-like [Papilio polytes]